MDDYYCGEDYLEDDDGLMCSATGLSSDSDDEEETFNFLKKLKQGQIKHKSTVFGKVDNEIDSSEDEFEKDMATELSNTMKQLTKLNKNKDEANTAAASASEPTDGGLAAESKKTEENEFYDDIYFDSDDDSQEGDTAVNPSRSDKKSSHRIVSNDDLLYDPNMDDRDQAWLDNKRRAYHFGKGKKSKNSTLKPLPHSDAVLNCPACLTMLCMDCQRHEIYNNQYRAMFVFNCNVDFTEKLKIPKKEGKKKSKRNKLKAKRRGNKLRNNKGQVDNKTSYKEMEEIKRSNRNSPNLVQISSSNSDGMNSKTTNELSPNDVSPEIVTSPSDVKETSDKNESKILSNSGDIEIPDNTKPPENKSIPEKLPFVYTYGVRPKETGAKLVNHPRLGNQYANQHGSTSSDTGCLPSGNTSIQTPSESTEGGEEVLDVDQWETTDDEGESKDLFHPVRCSICNTKVAVYDNDEVYHFFNVVTSY